MELIKPLKNCPFCGAKVHEAEGIAGLLFFACTNYKDCGAIVSFDNELCNRNPQLARDRFNQRKGSLPEPYKEGENNGQTD